MDDREMVLGCIRRDPDAWSTLVSRYGAFVHSRAAKSLEAAGAAARAVDVHDIFQNVFARLLERDARVLRQWEGRCNLSVWLGYVVRTECRRWLAEARRLPTAGPDLLETVLGSLAPPPEEAPPLDRERLGALLSELSPRDRLLLRLHFQQGLKVKEIAKLLNLSANSVGPALTRAVRRLLEKARPHRDF